MDISYDILKSFVIFGESKNIYEAAMKAKLSQPAISQHLRSFEVNFESPVFAIQGKKKILTKLGLELHEKLKLQFELIDDALNEIKRKSQDYTRMTLRIGARPGAISSIMDNTRFPGNIEYSNMGGADSVKAIISGKADFCFSRQVPDSLNIFAKKVVEINTHFIVHKSLLKKNSLSELREDSFLKKMPFFTYSSEIPYMIDWCKNNNFPIDELNTKGVLEDWKVIIKMVKRNQGYTLCPSGFLPDDEELVVLPVNKKEVPPLTLYLLYRKDTKDLFPVDKCFDLEGIKESLLSFKAY